MVILVRSEGPPHQFAVEPPDVRRTEPSMLNTRGLVFKIIFKNTNNTRILVRKTRILLLEPCVFYSGTPRICF